MLEDMIHLVEQTDNLWLLKKLKEIEKILADNPNNFVLGAELRKYLK